MTSLIDRAADLLFSQGNGRTLNVKFLCAGDDNVSMDDLAQQIIRAETQLANGTSKPVSNID